MLGGLLSRVLVFVVAPALTLAGGGLWHLRKSLPPVQGEVVAGVAAPVSVQRDAMGVPHIVAASDRDAFYAMGFVHAQDRLWQLEIQRRIAAGRLSEVFGKDSIPQDIWFRTLGFSQSARSAWTTLSPQAQQSLQAYADGINGWLAGNPVLPPEFAVFGIRPEPWTVFDSLAWAKVFALDLGGNFQREIDRLMVARSASPRTLQALFPQYPAGAALTVAQLGAAPLEPLQQLAQFQKTLESRLQIGGRFVGSNAWVVSGKLTANGAALLANDPHLALQIPSLWYMASLRGDQLDVAGATLVGLPVVVFGRNRQIAWGGTNLMADAQDLYLEQAKPEDNAYYAVNGQWVPFDTREEFIQVKQDFPAFLRNKLRPLRILVRSSRHGPIVSDMFKVLEQPAALRWTALDADDSSYEAFFRLNFAGDWDAFQQALSQQVAPAMNFVYADRAGNIGYLAAGRIPTRHGGDGMLPVPGWTDSYEWNGSIPFTAWPRSYNPASGFLVSANNKPVADDYPYLIGSDFATPTRADRITALLGQARDAGTPLDLAAMQRIQGDSQSEPARRLLGRLLQHEPSSDRQRLAYRYLKDWQGDMRGDSQAASIFNAWTRHLKRQLLANDLGGNWNKSDESQYTRSVVDSLDLDSLQRVLDDEQGQWCSPRDAVSPEPVCDDVLDVSLNRALRELLKIDGDDSMQDWAWSSMHETVYRHTPFSDVSVLRDVFQRRIGNGGSPDSVNVANFSLDKSGYVQDFGAGFRQLIALAPGAVEHLYMNSTGQSGNVMSKHYDDMVERFRNVEYAAMRSDSGGAQGITLIPAAAPRQPAEQAP
ncbi:penicillin amidase [Tahibacter aquaticus]|uniref:Penicillin amidase n=1 Tax=Tahibacter aquaticus TaxID=520092 RepID=A0A4V3DLP8_9GAMM|nr:penicillin acylase family protein [Tahibacter aquaticus]TDR40690.1 penicillin amidase [Tahibacter aquaticus]